MDNLTIQNFSCYYIFHPLSDTLSPQDQTIAAIASAALAILTVGLSHLICAIFFYDRNFLALPPSPKEPTVLDAAQLGLHVQESHDQFFPASPQVKYNARDVTKQKVEQILGLPTKRGAAEPTYQERVDNLEKVFGPEILDHVELFRDDDSTFTNPNYLLGSFDVLASPCVMDYNHEWQPVVSESAPYIVHHAAAVNIGEGGKGGDFRDYTLPAGGLDEDKYIEAMRHLFGNILEAQTSSKTHETVWFPFGMGAFLINLGNNDPSYNDPAKNFNLRKRIAAALIEQVVDYPDLQIHLSLPADQIVRSPTNLNHDAFVLAVADAPDEARARIHLYINTDATHLAQTLANEKGSYKVSLVNGANRNLLGNHWFGRGALVAIDENLHRRSSMLSAISALLNNGFKYQKRAENELEQTIKLLVPTLVQDIEQAPAEPDTVS